MIAKQAQKGSLESYEQLMLYLHILQVSCLHIHPCIKPRITPSACLLHPAHILLSLLVLVCFCNVFSLHTAVSPEGTSITLM